MEGRQTKNRTIDANSVKPCCSHPVATMLLSCAKYRDACPLWQGVAASCRTARGCNAAAHQVVCPQGHEAAVGGEGVLATGPQRELEAVAQVNHLQAKQAPEHPVFKGRLRGDCFLDPRERSERFSNGEAVSSLSFFVRC